MFEDALMTLFSVCIACQGQNVKSNIVSVIGTMVNVEVWCCTCEHHWKWSSQPEVAGIPKGNILLSAAILFAGAMPRKSLRVLKLSPRTFFRHKEKFLHQTVRSIWADKRDEMHGSLSGSELTLGGDGSDSMGHSTKFGTYTIMDLHTKKVIELQTVQVSMFHTCIN